MRAQGVVARIPREKTGRARAAFSDRIALPRSVSLEVAACPRPPFFSSSAPPRGRYSFLVANQWTMEYCRCFLVASRGYGFRSFPHRPGPTRSVPAPTRCRCDRSGGRPIRGGRRSAPGRLPCVPSGRRWILPLGRNHGDLLRSTRLRDRPQTRADNAHFTAHRRRPALSTSVSSASAPPSATASSAFGPRVNSPTGRFARHLPPGRCAAPDGTHIWLHLRWRGVTTGSRRCGLPATRDRRGHSVVPRPRMRSPLACEPMGRPLT